MCTNQGGFGSKLSKTLSPLSNEGGHGHARTQRELPDSTVTCRRQRSLLDQ
jgi:hypothetical protein